MVAWLSYHICWWIVDALAQGNAYKPQKEPIDYHEPGEDRNHNLQTEATPPAASCPAWLLHATEILCKKKTQSQWHARGCTEQLTTCPECTGVNFNTRVCYFWTAPWRWQKFIAFTLLEFKWQRNKTFIKYILWLKIIGGMGPWFVPHLRVLFILMEVETPE